MKTPIFTGASAALITPFRGGEIDFDALGRLLDLQKKAESEAVTLCATTGEGATMSDDEFISVLTYARHYLGDSMKIIAGCSGNDTKKVIEKCTMANLCGADAALITTPYYNKTTQDGLVRHYERISCGTELPIILYNVPSRTGMSFTAETYKRLSEIETINGVKEASGDFDLIGKTVSLCGDDLFIWSGNDNQTVPVMSLGGRGVISVAANIMPQTMMELCDLCDDNDFPAAREILRETYELIETMFCAVNPIPIKKMMSLLGYCMDEVRLPLVMPDDTVTAKIQSVLDKYAERLR